MVSPAFPEASSSRCVDDIADEERDDVLIGYLARDPVANLFMLSWLDNYGVSARGRPDLFRFRVARSGGRVRGVALLITDRLLLLDSDDADVAASFGAWHGRGACRLEHIVSPRRCVVPFWTTYSTAVDSAARLVRDQELHVLDREEWLRARPVRHATELAGGVRIAEARDAHAVFWASAAMHAEETLEDPLVRDAAQFRRHVEHRVEGGRTWVWFDGRRRLLFKADISAQSPWGAQISGVYTPPALRGQGIATQAMYDICDALFDSGFPRITLYVNRTNEAARRVYRRVGFRFWTDYQTIFVAS